MDKVRSRVLDISAQQEVPCHIPVSSILDERRGNSWYDTVIHIRIVYNRCIRTNAKCDGLRRINSENKFLPVERRIGANIERSFRECDITSICGTVRERQRPKPRFNYGASKRCRDCRCDTFRNVNLGCRKRRSTRNRRIRREAHFRSRYRSRQNRLGISRRKNGVITVTPNKIHSALSPRVLIAPIFLRPIPDVILGGDCESQFVINNRNFFRKFQRAKHWNNRHLFEIGFGRREKRNRRIGGWRRGERHHYSGLALACRVDGGRSIAERVTAVYCKS